MFREKQGIDLRTGHCVKSLNTARREVSGTTLTGGAFQVNYDKLLIATGATPRVPNVPGSDLPGVMVLKNLEDGRRMKQFVRDNQVRKAVILGMGYIAMEMCEALRSRDIEVDMVKPGPVFIPWMNPELSSFVKKELEVNRVGIHLGRVPRGITKTGAGLKVICENLDLDCQMVLIAVGVKPCSDLAEKSGLSLGPSESISVDRKMLTSDGNIYAAGDCADAYHVVTGKKAWIPLALRANRAGWAVADNVLGAGIELEGVAGTAVYKVFDLEVARTGLSLEEAKKHGFDPSEAVIESRTRAHTYPGGSPLFVQVVGDRESGRLLGVQIVGKEGAAHRINAPAVALHARMTVRDFSQSDLAYAPPFGPSWDPMLTAANQLLKAL